MTSTSTTPSVPQIFDTVLLQRRRARVAAHATVHDFLVQRSADDLVERLTAINRTFPTAADIGAHTGALGHRLAESLKSTTLISIDDVPASLELCTGERRAGSWEKLPLEPQSLDMAVSALSLHLVNDVPGALVQVHRALKPDGLLMVSLLGGATLNELRTAWLEAEGDVYGGASPRVAPFADIRDCGALLQRAGFALPVADSEIVTVTYASPMALMQEIKAMGTSNMLRERHRRPVTRTLLSRACEIYQDRFALPNGRVPATFEIITLTAWVPHESQQKPLQPGSAKTRLADALATKEHKI